MKPLFKLLFRSAGPLCALWVLADALFLAAAFFGWPRGLMSLAALIPLDPAGYALRGVALLLALPAMFLGAAALMFPISHGSSDDQIQLDNERGKVRLSSRTLSEYLQKKSSQLAGVNSVRIRVQNGSAGKVSLDVEAVVYADEPLPVVTQRIQDSIEEELKGTFGVDKIEGVNIRFRKIADLEPQQALPSPVLSEEPRGEESETIEVKTNG